MYAGPSDPKTIAVNAVITGLPFVWMLIGVYVLWNARSPVIHGAVYTIPALVGAICLPAMILILQNLS